jgi:hypothetical protein
LIMRSIAAPGVDCDASLDIENRKHAEAGRTHGLA